MGQTQMGQIASLTTEVTRAEAHAGDNDAEKMSMWAALWHPRNADTRKKFYAMTLAVFLTPIVVMTATWTVLAWRGYDDPSFGAGIAAVASVVLVLGVSSVYVTYDDDDDEERADRRRQERRLRRQERSRDAAQEKAAERNERFADDEAVRKAPKKKRN